MGSGQAAAISPTGPTAPPSSGGSEFKSDFADSNPRSAFAPWPWVVLEVRAFRVLSHTGPGVFQWFQTTTEPFCIKKEKNRKFLVVVF